LPLVIHVYLGSLNTQMRLLWIKSIFHQSRIHLQKDARRVEAEERSRLLIILVQVCTTPATTSSS